MNDPFVILAVVVLVPIVILLVIPAIIQYIDRIRRK